MFEEIISFADKLDFNIYDIAMMDESGVRAHYFQKCNPCNNGYSTTKAFTMTALGLLWDDGQVDLYAPALKYFPEYDTDETDPKWRAVTVHDVLTHKMGIDRGFLDIDAEDASAYPTDDYLSMVFSRPLAHKPGTFYAYSDAAYYLLSRVVEAIAGLGPIGEDRPEEYYFASFLFFFVTEDGYVLSAYEEHKGENYSGMKKDAFISEIKKLAAGG